MSKNKLAPGAEYFLRFDKKIVISTPSGKPHRVFASLVDKKGNLVAPIGIKVDDLVDFISFVNVAKNTEPAPKYDPCRLFRKGDKVKLKEEIDGRKLSEFVMGLTLGKIYTVEEDEKNHIVVIDSDNGLCRYCFVHLELVTPVEELEPYFIEETEYEYCVSIMVGERKDTPATYHKRMHPHAKEAAEAERDRLNAEYRKEQK